LGWWEVDVRSKVEKKFDASMERARAMLEGMRPVSKSSVKGSHKHVTMSEGVFCDGDHSHTFTMPRDIVVSIDGGGKLTINAGTVLKAIVGGPHGHRIVDGSEDPSECAHRHIVPLSKHAEWYTETDGVHTHVDGAEGFHQHVMALGDLTLRSDEVVDLSLSSLNPAVCSIAQTGTIDEIASEVLSSPDNMPVIVWQADPPKGSLPTLKVPDPRFIIDRLVDGKSAGLISLKRRSRRVGQPQMLVNEVGPLGLSKAFIWAVVAHGEPVELTNIEELPMSQREGLDKFTSVEFGAETNLFHLPLELAVVFDPPLELARPPGGRRFGSTVDLEKDVVVSRQLSIEDVLRDAARRRIHDFVNDPSEDTLRRATTGHLLEIDRQLHNLFERAFAAKDVSREEGVTRDDTVNAHELVLRELKRRRVATREDDALAAETYSVLGLSFSTTPARATGPKQIVISLQESTTVQTLIFSKDIFESAEQAKAWAKEHDFKFGSVDETSTSFRLRQIDPDQFVDGSFRTIDITEGVKAVIGVLKVEGSKQTKQAPTSSMSREELIAAREARSRDYGIEIVEGSALTFPAGFPTSLNDYGDPVNLKYPIETVERARNARERFKQFADETYERERSKAVVHERIVRRELQFGVQPTFDPDDPLDALLPSDLKSKLAMVVPQSVRFLKRDSSDERYVFGVVLIPNETDAQGDIYSVEDVRKAAHSFMENGQRSKIMHSGRPVQGITVLETYLSKQSETHAGETFPEGTWFLGVRVNNDDIWNAIKRGSFTGFSMGGTAIKEPLN